MTADDMAATLVLAAGAIAACHAPASPAVRDGVRGDVVARPAPDAGAVAVDARAADVAGLPTTVLPCIPSNDPDLLVADDGTPVLSWDTAGRSQRCATTAVISPRAPARGANRSGEDSRRRSTRRRAGSPP
jgi:hypothetical protein